MHKWYALQPAMYSVYEGGIFHIQCGIPYTSAGERPDILKGFGNYEVTY